MPLALDLRRASGRAFHDRPVFGQPLEGGVSTEADARAALQRLDPPWDEFFPAEQARIVALLVERVDIGINGLNIRLCMDGLTGLAREMLAGDMERAA